MKIHQGFQLKELNTMGMSSMASYFIEVESLNDALLLARDDYFRSLAFLIMGGGSNLLFIGDFRGAVLRFTPSNVEVISEDDESIVLKVESGKEWHSFVMECAEKGLWGIENLALIPGDVGATAVQNIGAYGAEVSQVIEAIHTIDLVHGEEVTWNPEECNYSYRHSIFKEEDKQHFLITAVSFRLSKKPVPNLKYAGLQTLNGVEGLTALQVATEVIRIRESKLPDPRELANAGSFFMNPIVSQQHFTSLLLEYPEIPHYALPEGAFKIPAAWLIEQAGLKGYREGNVGTYPKQPLVLVNYSDAFSYEVVDFAEMIQQKVYEQFGISLQPEVRYVRSGALESIDQYRLGR